MVSLPPGGRPLQRSSGLRIELTAPTPVQPVLPTLPSSSGPSSPPLASAQAWLGDQCFLQLIPLWGLCLVGFSDSWESSVVFSSTLSCFYSHCTGQASIFMRELRPQLKIPTLGFWAQFIGIDNLTQEVPWREASELGLQHHRQFQDTVPARAWALCGRCI